MDVAAISFKIQLRDLFRTERSVVYSEFTDYSIKTSTATRVDVSKSWRSPCDSAGRATIHFLDKGAIPVILNVPVAIIGINED